MSDRKVLKERRFKAGYVIRDELVDGSKYACPDFVMKVAYTHEGHYIGDTKTAHRLCVKYGIKPDLAPENNNCGSPRVCSIGFSERDQKWYGWSHRAMFGFTIGSEAKEGDCVTTSGWTQEWLTEHPEDDISVPVGFKAETMGDARRMAIAFAESVG